MKNIMKRMTALVMMLLSSLMLFTGCNWSSSGSGGGDGAAEEPDAAVSVAIVTGARSNVNRISVNAKELSDKVYESAYSNGRVVLVRCDGKPEQYLLADIPKPNVEGLSESKLDSIARGYRDEILAAFDRDGAAKYPEADTLEAVRISANALRETVYEGDKYLIIVDSGLSTTGYLDFTKGLLDAPADEIVSELSKEKAIPDLTGIDVIWLYCGETAEPQQPLSELQKSKLREIYGAVFEAGNANSCVFRDEAPSAEPYTDLPEVSVVRADAREIDVDPITAVKLDPGKVRFIGDSDEFVDPAAAKKEIKKVADILLKNPDNNVYVVGGTAGADGNNDYCRKLSDARARAVVKVLEEYGVPDSQLKPAGLGGNTPWHIDDTDANGNMIEEKAQKNRAVWIVDVNDPDYGKALSAMI